GTGTASGGVGSSGFSGYRSSSSRSDVSATRSGHTLIDGSPRLGALLYIRDGSRFSHSKRERRARMPWGRSRPTLAFPSLATSGTPLTSTSRLNQKVVVAI